MTKFDVLQVFINGSAAAGVIALWIELTKRAIGTVWSLINNNEPFYDSSSDWSDDCIEEESPQIPKPNHSYRLLNLRRSKF